MFGRENDDPRIAYEWAGGHHEHRHHHPHEHEGQWGPWGRGPFQMPPMGPRFAPPIGPRFWGMFGPGGHHRRSHMFGRGDLKFALLELLKERPKHGYEMIKELESRAAGFYTPSAGSVYPTLQMMEDRGWVTSATVEGKKVYTITETGLQALKERQPDQGPGPEQEQPFGGPPPEWGRRGPGGGWGRGPFGPFSGPELRGMRDLGLELGGLFRQAIIKANSDPAQLAKLQAIVAQTRDALRAFVNDTEQPAAPSDDKPDTPPSTPTTMV